MDLYFQEHDVDPNVPPPDSDNLVRALRLVAEAAMTVPSSQDYLRNEILRLIEQRSRTDASMRGKPPASADAIRTLPIVNPRPTADGPVSCPICTEDFTTSESARQLPCNHLFHKECVVPWLQHQCTCPLCRTELPTDDARYEEEKKRQKRQAAVEQMNSLMYN